MNEPCCVSELYYYTLSTMLLFALVSVFYYIRLHRWRSRVKEAERATADQISLREASEELSFQVKQLRTGLQNISRAENPLEALAQALSARNGNNKNEPT